MNESDKSILREIVSHIDAIELRIEKHSIDEDLFVGNDEYQDMLLMPVSKLENSLIRLVTN